MCFLTVKGVKYSFDKGLKLIDIIRQNNITFETPCGGGLTCGKCKVILKSGDVNPITNEEEKFLTVDELSVGTRLACFMEPKGDICIDFPEQLDDKNKILTKGILPEHDFKPNINKKTFEFHQHCLKNELSYLEALENVLDEKVVANKHLILQQLPSIIKEKKITAIYSNNYILGVEKKDTTSSCYGVAIDIGTTTVVASLVNLITGQEIEIESALNPQTEYGLDVLSRIDFVRKNKGGLELLHNGIINCLNRLIMSLCKNSKIDKENIYEIAVAANTTMLHILLNVDPTCMGKSPYKSVFIKENKFLASELGIKISAYGMVYTLPGVSSFVGSDIVAGVCAGSLFEKGKKSLFIDVGTNGEMVLYGSGQMVACACAAGPALEGMNIKNGMRATSGAVENVKIIDSQVFLKVIGDIKPIGICGSGIIDCISELLQNKVIGLTGRIKNQDNIESLPKGVAIKDGSTRSIMLSSANGEISVTQNDVRQVQLAKGAILSGIYTLLDYVKLSIYELDEVIIAGQFGAHLNVESLIGVGMLPSTFNGKVRYIGNSSVTGAILYLLSRNFREIIRDITGRIDYVELSTMQDYEKTFTKALTFKKI
ncbi:ASKHA domain-containing protein [Proteinivorax tanatarense]|uniref:ASKHA domain-containing protein n=1 Tax=Proteinivorax tanatarense TaxID=1260629 RepID=A0AAU7VHE5_9FIRM